MLIILNNLKNIIYAVLAAAGIGWLGIKFGESKAKDKAKLTSEEKANEKLHEIISMERKVNKLDRAALLRILSDKK